MFCINAFAAKFGRSIYRFVKCALFLYILPIIQQCSNMQMSVVIARDARENGREKERKKERE